jgi:hypothetical protein
LTKHKDFVAAQISISERADHALSAGLKALGNVSESGKAIVVLNKPMP